MRLSLHVLSLFVLSLSLSTINGLKNKEKSVLRRLLQSNQNAYEKCKNIDGGGWRLYRHTPANRWHKYSDDLLGLTSDGGVLPSDVQNHYDSGAQWTIEWRYAFGTDANEAEFLFATQDCSVWLVTHRLDIYAGYPYSNGLKFIHNNSQTFGPKCSRWFLREPSSSPEDPLIYLNDYPNFQLYGENNIDRSGTDLANYGMNVWIRHKPNYGVTNRVQCPLPPVEPYEKCKNIDGGGWELYRHAPTNTWHQQNDDLLGLTSTGGVSASDAHFHYNSGNPWTIQWKDTFGPDANYAEFLFATSDCSVWLVTHKMDIYAGHPYTFDLKFIHNNSQTLGAKCARWTFRIPGTVGQSQIEDPQISLNDHPNLVLYAESGIPREADLAAYGMNVWIRQNAGYNMENRHHCPLTASPVTSSPVTSPVTSTSSPVTPSPVTPPQCITPFDIIFVIDGSTSIGAVNYRTQLQFVASVTRKMAINTRVGVIIFSSVITQEITLDDSIDVSLYGSLNDVANAIETISYPSGNTHTRDALLSSISMYQASNVMTPARDRLVFLMTDGIPSTNQNPCEPLSASLRSNFDSENIRVYSVAVGNKINAQATSLQCLSVNPSTDIFHSPTFSQQDFHMITYQFLSLVCPSNS